MHASDNTFNFIDLNDDVFGNARLRGTSIDHLDKGDAIIVALRDSHLAEYLVFAGYDDAVEISRNIILPAIQALKCYTIATVYFWIKRQVIIDAPEIRFYG